MALVAGISGSVSLVGVAANLLVAPTIAAITVLGTAAAALGLLWPVGADLLLRFTGPPVWWLLVVARCAAALPAASIAVPAGFAGVVTVAVVVAVMSLAWHWVVSARHDTIGG